MAQFRFLLPVLAFASASLLATASAAQSGSDSTSAPYPSKPLPSDLSGSSYATRPLQPTQNIEPSAFNTFDDAHPIAFLSQDQMAETDRALAASVQPSIRENATLAGIDFDAGKWNYQQLVCAALPSHLFLVFREENGTGDVSLFSAAIARAGSQHVRVIPIRRRGFSLFSPAPVNPLTIAAFNRIRAGEPASKTADWLSTALCYAALTGAHPQTSSSAGKPGGVDLSLSFPPTLEVGGLGESIVRFVDVAPARQPMQWALTFDPKGQLVKVVQFASPPYQITPLPSLSDQKSTPQATR